SQIIPCGWILSCWFNGALNKFPFHIVESQIILYRASYISKDNLEILEIAFVIQICEFGIYEFVTIVIFDPLRNELSWTLTKLIGGECTCCRFNPIQCECNHVSNKFTILRCGVDFFKVVTNVLDSIPMMSLELMNLESQIAIYKGATWTIFCEQQFSHGLKVLEINLWPIKIGIRQMIKFTSIDHVGYLGPSRETCHIMSVITKNSVITHKSDQYHAVVTMILPCILGMHHMA
ncbi:hypothetical protein ACJX0J_033975, partial [Zea mays]